MQSNSMAAEENYGLNMEELPRKWIWLFVLGVIMIAGGVIGLYSTVFLTLVTVTFFGFLFITGGVLQIIQGIVTKEKKWQGKWQHFINSIIYLITGCLIVYDPVAASIGITLFIAGMSFALGLVKLRYAFQKRKIGWKWAIPAVIGIIDILLAILIAIQWPVSGLYVIGLFVSIELIMNGYFLLFTSLAVRRLQKEGK